jgi:hypothetical protein
LSRSGAESFGVPSPVLSIVPQTHWSSRRVIDLRLLWLPCDL